MSDWLSATIGGLLNMGTSAMSSFMSYPMQKKMDRKAYQRQVALLQMQQNFAERMANTAHQREVADLRKAGLNPILSATGGQGAVSPVVSAPGVSSGSKVDFDFGSPGDAFANIESASSAFLNKKLAEKAGIDSGVANAEIGKIRAEAEKIRAEAEVEKAKAKAVNKTEKTTNLLTDPDTWRGVLDFFNGASSARSSSDSKYLHPAYRPNEYYISDPEPLVDVAPTSDGWKRGYHYYDFGRKKYTNSRPNGSYMEITPDGKRAITIIKKYGGKK